MQRDPRAYLWDVCESAAAIAGFVEGADLESYRSSAMMRSAVERQLEIIGEALNQLSQVAPDLADKLPDRREAIGLRNVRIHGYAVIDDATIWQTVQRDIPRLRQHAAALLKGQGNAP